MIDASRGLTIILYFEFCEFAGAGDDWRRSLSVGSLEAKGLEFHPNICRRINHRISIEMESSNGQMNRANTAHSI